MGVVDGEDCRLAGAEVADDAEDVLGVCVVTGRAGLGVGQGVKERDLESNAAEDAAAFQRVFHPTVRDHRIVDVSRDGEPTPDRPWHGLLGEQWRGQVALAQVGEDDDDEFARVLGARGDLHRADDRRAQEIPQSMPSSFARRRAISNDSSSLTRITSSMTSVFNTSGMNPAEPLDAVLARLQRLAGGGTD